MHKILYMDWHKNYTELSEDKALELKKALPELVLF